MGLALVFLNPFYVFKISLAQRHPRPRRPFFPGLFRSWRDLQSGRMGRGRSRDLRGAAHHLPRQQGIRQKVIHRRSI